MGQISDIITANDSSDEYARDPLSLSFQPYQKLASGNGLATLARRSWDAVTCVQGLKMKKRVLRVYMSVVILKVRRRETTVSYATPTS